MKVSFGVLFYSDWLFRFLLSFVLLRFVTYFSADLVMLCIELFCFIH